jgi:hypothetical protein
LEMLRMEDHGNCDRCKRPLIEIDHYGERHVERIGRRLRMAARLV